MSESTPALEIPITPSLRPLRLILAALACLVVALVNGLALALVETFQTAAEALRAARDAGRLRLWLDAVWALVRGLFETLFAGTVPFFGNVLVGIGAALELVKQAWDDEDPQFELVVGGGLNMSFSSRTRDVFTRAEIVKVGVRSRYPVIESIEYVTGPLFPEEDTDTMVDEEGSTLFSAGITDLRSPPGEFAAASVMDGLKRFATHTP